MLARWRSKLRVTLTHEAVLENQPFSRHVRPCSKESSSQKPNENAENIPRRLQILPLDLALTK